MESRRLTCAACGRKYLEEDATGIRLCACGRPVQASYPKGRQEIPLTFSDHQVGTTDFGVIDRNRRDPDDEDLDYQRHIRKITGDNAWTCADGVLRHP